jgi:hypothetical protein
MRTLNLHVLARWKATDPNGARHRGLVFADATPPAQAQPGTLARLSQYLNRWPALESIYRFKHRLEYLLLEKGLQQARSRKLAHRFLRDVRSIAG